MPNWVRGRITIEGKNVDKVIEEITNEVTDERDGTFCRVLDFNKIIPMPETLRVVSGSIADECVDIYLNSLEKTEKENVLKMLKEKSREEYSISDYGKRSKYKTNKLIKEILRDYSEPRPFFDVQFRNKQEILDYGKQICDNVDKYGFKDWYYWSIANWGTKWNACDCYIKGNIIDFQTAWSDIRKLVLELSSKYPENEFTYIFSMEQLGAYCGEFVAQNGEVITDIDFDDDSKSAWDTAFELWEVDPEFYNYDEDTDSYKYVGDEEAEKICAEREKQTESEQT